MSASLPLVGLSLARGIWHTTGVSVFYSPEAYSRALAMAGIVPVLIPNTLDESALRAIYERVDGIVLAGGGDIAPQQFGLSPDSEAAAFCEMVDPNRDTLERKLVQWAYHEDKPLLGICRGHQMMNVSLGGTLITDIPAFVGQTVRHEVSQTPEWRSTLLHSVQIQPETRLANILGATQVEVNSIHHQAIDQLGEGLQVSAVAPDGLVEAVEKPHARFFMGVQWHPEEIAHSSPPMQALFRAFAASLI